MARPKVSDAELDRKAVALAERRARTVATLDALAAAHLTAAERRALRLCCLFCNEGAGREPTPETFQLAEGAVEKLRNAATAEERRLLFSNPGTLRLPAFDKKRG